ncbi:MAG: GFA family protein [Pseudomonadota bacterium]
MQITGGCHCGNVAYRASGSTKNALICHCTDCQVMSGTVYRTVMFVDESNFELLRGELKLYVKTADDGNRRAMMFCDNCGCHIYATNVDRSAPRTFGVRLGTSDQRHKIIPRTEVWEQSKLAWLGETI